MKSQWLGLISARGWLWNLPTRRTISHGLFKHRRVFQPTRRVTDTRGNMEWNAIAIKVLLSVNDYRHVLFWAKGAKKDLRHGGNQWQTRYIPVNKLLTEFVDIWTPLVRASGKISFSVYIAKRLISFPKIHQFYTQGLGLWRLHRARSWRSKCFQCRCWNDRGWTPR